MKNCCEIITSVALVAFVLALCMIECNPIASVITMSLSGAWIVFHGYLEEEERRMREGR